MKLWVYTIMVSLWCHYAQASPVDLKQCYEAALSYATRTKISQQQIDEAQATYHQLLGRSLPRLNLRASEFFQDDPGTAGSGVPNTFVRTERPELAINFSLPSFRGVREWQILKGANLNTEQQKQRHRQAQRLLYADVVQAFYSAVTIEKDLLVIAQLLEVQQARNAELKRRVRLGKSRPSDAITQVTDTTLLEARQLTQQGNKKTAYAMLRFLTGLNDDITVLIPSSIPPAVPSQVTELPDVAAARLAVEISQFDKRSRRTEYLPYLNLDANYYLYRVGFQEDVIWDATVALTLPLFNWETVGNNRLIDSQLQQQNLQLIQTQRQVAYEMEMYDDQLKTASATLEKYQAAATQAQQSYQLNVTDYQRGLVSNLEVMQAQRTWLEALRSVAQAEVDVWLRYHELMLSRGALPFSTGNS